jgi:hypothetical protein
MHCPVKLPEQHNMFWHVKYNRDPDNMAAAVDRELFSGNESPWL